VVEPADATSPGEDSATPDSQGTPDATPDQANPIVDAGGSKDADAGGDATAPTEGGACQLSDGGTGTLCASGCTSLASDPANCGACGTICEAGALCAAAGCQNVAVGLNGLRWELPCTSPSNGVNCPSTVDGSLEEVLTTTISGSTGTTYQVTLHFRGIVEQKTYTDFDAGGAIPGEPDTDAGNPGFFINGG
jgi:hypothetical protein